MFTARSFLCIKWQVAVSHDQLAPLPANSRQQCINICHADDPGEYPLFENPEMDAYLIQVIEFSYQCFGTRVYILGFIYVHTCVNCVNAFTLSSKALKWTPSMYIYIYTCMYIHVYIYIFTCVHKHILKIALGLSLLHSPSLVSRSLLPSFIEQRQMRLRFDIRIE